MSRLATRSDIRMGPRPSITEHKHYTKHIIASYCLQSLIGPANLLLAKPEPIMLSVLPIIPS